MSLVNTLSPNSFSGVRKGLYLTIFSLLTILSISHASFAQEANSEKAAPKEILNRSLKVKFVMPVKGLISSVFGVARINHRHKGIDIATPTGTPIQPAAPGQVVFAGWQTGYGNTLIIEHADGSLTRYAHAQQLLVDSGTIVDTDDYIATVGSTGHSTGPHLHFEIMNKFGQQVNPLSVLTQNGIEAPESEVVADAKPASDED